MAFSELQTYLESLPYGLDRSFTDCKVKGSLLREPLSIRPLRALDRMPPSLAAMASHLPLPSEWIPATYYAALLMAAVDEQGLDRDGYIAYSREVTTALTQGTYSVLLGVVHPETLLRGASSLWSYFHTGTSLAARRVEGVFELALTAPTGLLPPRLIDGYGGTIQAMIDRSRVPAARVERPVFRASGPSTIATFRVGGW